MIKKTYSITGFDCASCASKSETHLNKNEYIESAVIDFNNDRLHVTFKEKELPPKELKKIIKEVEDDPIEIEELNQKTIKKSYIITGFDCASCASKSEAHLNKHECIDSCVIDFSADRLHVTYKEKELSPSELKSIIAEVEDDPIEIKELGEKTSKKSLFDKEMIFTLCRVLVGVITIIFSLTLFHEEQFFWVNFGIFAFALLLLSYDVYFAVIKHIIHLENPFDEELLMTITSIGAFVVASISQETHLYIEGLMVMILFQIGEIIEGIATNKSKNAIMSAVSLRVETANKVVGGDVITVKPEELNIGDVVIVSTGEQVPVDGYVLEGNAELDTSSLTGEFVPIAAKEELEIFAGYIVKSGSIRVRVNKEYKDSAVNKVVELITNSGAKKSKADEFVTKFARIYTPIIFTVALLTGLIGGLITLDYQTWLILGLKMLVVGCPCSIVISVPLAYFAAVGLASKNGVVVKGTNYLDQLVNLKKVVTDKTGTLTKGVFVITKKYAVNGNEEELMKYLVAAEYLSTHPIGVAICKHQEIDNIAKDVSDYQEIAGKGVSVAYKGKKVLAGNERLMTANGITFEEVKEAGSVVYLAVDGKFYGYVVVSDEIKEDAKEMVALLNKEGIETILLTGDKESNAKALCEELGIARYKAELLPEDKLHHLENELDKKYATAFVGDGINDAASIKEADVGFAMGAIGSDVAVESADVVIMNDDPSKVYDAYKISKIARGTALFNIIFSLLIKIGIEVAALITSLLGRGDVIPMWLAVLADTGLTVSLVINSLLILYRKINHKSV